MRWLAVANRAAGRWRDAERLLAALEGTPGLSAVAAFTDGPGSGTHITRGARDFDGVIVIGGDGTISECLCGMDLPRQRLAILPAGHGMCLARDLGVTDARAALAALVRPQWRSIDLMEVTIHAQRTDPQRRLCASTMSVGYVTDVVTTGRGRLPALGRAAYAAAAMITVPREFRARHGDGDDASWTTITGMVVNNTMHLANFRAFPRARLDDGLLDVMVQRCRWPRQQLHNCAVLAGSSAFGPQAMQQRARMQLDLERSATLMADGELFRDVTRVTVACRTAAVTCAARPA